ncbi:hypothetical protein [Plantactinospora soyae]|uniref:Uncharacterized protein n=1 Tax=Plantactinospora soyae TaxID=1544732 RepID=A0A927R7U6_9ACTN|nr:hypothetical protein [Plantactinospora soyae]MBE1489824.1 hypothetical protein [Plantactinospora soyae]
MSTQNDFRQLATIELRRVFTSLGMPVTAFHQTGTPGPLFDTVLNTDPSRPNGLWLFKGAEYFLYDLETGSIEEGPRLIAGNFAGDSLPQMFRSGIHSTVWGGPAFPHLWYAFKDEMFVRINSSTAVPGTAGESAWRVDFGPRGVLGEWATGAWTNPDGSWRTSGVPVALHGVGSRFHGMIHFFKDGQYVRHNLNTGGTDAGPMPIRQAWNLPEDFPTSIDVAFYGTGQNEENIFFIAGLRYVLYDFRQNRVLDQGSVENRFPAFAQFLGRPQLFLVEDYALETLVGAPHLGRLIDTRSIGAGSTIKRILVTETLDTSKTSLGQSLLTSQESSVVSNFYDRVDKNTSSGGSTESYKYQLNAQAHADANATSLWGGEANATLNVQGGTNTTRAGFNKATFNSMQTQVDEAKKQTEQKTYNSEDEFTQSAKILKKEIFEEKNSTDKVRVYEFYEQLQPYLTLLVLRHVRVGYSDGTTRPEVVELSALRGLLDRVLVEPARQTQLTGYLGRELANVTDQEGKPRSLLMDSSDLVLLRNVTSTYQVQRADGTAQTITVRGIITGDRTWVEPTYTITCVQV